MKKIKLNKRDVIVLIVIAIVIVFAFTKYVVFKEIDEYKFAKQMETIFNNNERTIFSIDKIVLYSSAGAIDNSEGQTMQDMNICQFTDMAIYIDNTSYIKELKEENTVKELYIDNIKIDTSSNKGIKTLTYRSPLTFGKFKTSTEDAPKQEASGTINFDILYTNEDNEKSDYQNPTFYTDCSNPITLHYLNENIVTGYAVSTQSTQIKFDGSILQSVGIILEDIQGTVNFTIHLKNNLDEEFECSLGIEIPLKTEGQTIYSGYTYMMQNELQNTYKFFKK